MTRYDLYATGNALVTSECEITDAQFHLMRVTNATYGGRDFSTPPYSCHHSQDASCPLPMKLHQLSALVKVAEMGSIQAAARALFMTQPAVSRAIRDLEIELGVMLMQRTPKGVYLTTAGALLVKHARSVQQELQRAQAEIESIKGGAAITLTLAAAPIATRSFLPDAMLAFMKFYPDVRVAVREMRPDQINDALKDGTAEIGIGHLAGDELMPHFTCVRLCDFSMAVFARAKHPLHHSACVDDFSASQWILRDPPRDIEHIFVENGYRPPECYLHCTSLEMTMRIMSGTNMLSWGAAQLLQFQHGANTDFHVLDFPGTLPRRSIYATYRDYELLSWAAKKFLQVAYSTVKFSYPAEVNPDNPFA
jgi:LysR family transcriptional regulator, regulator of abg operon